LSSLTLPAPSMTMTSKRRDSCRTRSGLPGAGCQRACSIRARSWSSTSARAARPDSRRCHWASGGIDSSRARARVRTPRPGPLAPGPRRLQRRGEVIRVCALNGATGRLLLRSRAQIAVVIQLLPAFDEVPPMNSGRALMSVLARLRCARSVSASIPG
jgi:hypothetical protein